VVKGHETGPGGRGPVGVTLNSTRLWAHTDLGHGISPRCSHVFRGNAHKTPGPSSGCDDTPSGRDSRQNEFTPYRLTSPLEWRTRRPRVAKTPNP